MADIFMVFDVESIGLHGEGFAAAWVVVTRAGQRLDEGFLACDSAQCKGTDANRAWVHDNVPHLPPNCPSPQQLRDTFWHHWRYWADRGAQLVADCGWPVETNFLSACAAQNMAAREWQGPYPLHDLESVLLALGAHAPASAERQPDELPAHHPLMDARHSARQLMAALASNDDRKPPNLLISHTLIGRRVEWRGAFWVVTGARRGPDPNDGCAFRLLPLNANSPHKEVWTECRPCFGSRSTFSVQDHLAALPPRAAGYVRRAIAAARGG